MGILRHIEDNARIMLLGMTDFVAPATPDEWDERLRTAVVDGMPKLAETALSQGASTQQFLNFDARKVPLIIVAAERGYADVVKLLVKNGAPVNAKDTFGDTAIVKAVENDWPKVVATLAGNGAEVNIINANGQSLLERARAIYAHDTAEILGRHGGKLSAQLNAVAGKLNVTPAQAGAQYRGFKNAGI
jgi:hypothetical protein